MINPEIDQSDMIYIMGQKQDRKYQNQEMSTFLFALDYVLESLQRSRLYVNNKKIINNEGKRVFEAN